MAKQLNLNVVQPLPALDNVTKAALEGFKSGALNLHNVLCDKLEHAANRGSGDMSQISRLVVELINEGFDSVAEEIKAWVKAYSCAAWRDDTSRFTKSETAKKKRKAEGLPAFDYETARNMPYWEFRKPKKTADAWDSAKALSRIIDAEKAACIREAKAFRKAVDEGLTIDGDVTAFVERLIADAARLNITIDIPETYQREAV